MEYATEPRENWRIFRSKSLWRQRRRSFNLLNPIICLQYLYGGQKRIVVEAYYEKVNDNFSLDDIGPAGQRAGVCGRRNERILRQIRTGRSERAERAICTPG